MYKIFLILLLLITPLFSCSDNDSKRINITYDQAKNFLTTDDYFKGTYFYYYEYEEEQYYKEDHLIDTNFKETNFNGGNNFKYYRSQNYDEILRGELVEKVEKIYLGYNSLTQLGNVVIANNLKGYNDYIHQEPNNFKECLKLWPWYQENVLSYDLIKESFSSSFNFDILNDLYDTYKVNIEDYYQDYLDEKARFYLLNDSLIIEYSNLYDYEEELTINKYGFIEKKVTKNKISDGEYKINTNIKKLYNNNDVKKYNIQFKNDVEVIENNKYLIETFHWIIEPFYHPNIIYHEKEIYDKFISYFDQFNSFDYYSEKKSGVYDRLSYHVDIIESFGETYTGEPLSIKVSDNGRVYTYCICKDSGIVTLYPSNGGTYISQNNKDIVNKIFDYYVELLLMDDQLDF